jgi:hypothetical protein
VIHVRFELAYLLGINALRASEAAAVRIEDYTDTPPPAHLTLLGPVDYEHHWQQQAAIQTAARPMSWASWPQLCNQSGWG